MKKKADSSVEEGQEVKFSYIPWKINSKVYRRDHIQSTEILTFIF